jgi:2-aminoadipate transaminase
VRRSSKSQRTTASPINELIHKALTTPGLISLAAGLVDEESLPAAAVAAACQAVLQDRQRAQAALQYGSTQGYPRLREQVAALLAQADRLSVHPAGWHPDNVLITTGSQQLLYLLAELLLDPGDIVITEAPSYFVFHSVLHSHGAQVLGVPVDEQGMNLTALAELLQQLDKTGELERVKMVYTVDYYQNPTGLTLAAARRPQLLELVQRYSRRQRIVLVEDAAYRQLRYEGEDMRSIKSWDSSNQWVVYAGTFSKPCAPGLKLGYALVPTELLEPLLHLKGNHDFGSAHWVQHVVSELVASGAYQRHIADLQQVYRSKRDVLLLELAEAFAGTEVRWTRPAGGLYVWLHCPGVDSGPQGPLAAAAWSEGVLYVPGEWAYVQPAGQRPPHQYCRLSFGVVREPEIREGVRRLRRAWERAKRGSPCPNTVAGAQDQP